MPFTPLVSAGLEGILNLFLWHDRSLKSARMRLYGKVLRVEVNSFPTPLVLVFGEQQLDVLNQWEGEADCTIVTRLSVLPKLNDRQRITALIRSGDLEVQGDIQVVQNLVSLLDLAEFDPVELLAPYIGDIAAEGIGKLVRGSGKRLKNSVSRNRRYLAEAITEEWRIAPGALEVAWFSEETTAVTRDVEALSARLDKLEGR